MIELVIIPLRQGLNVQNLLELGYNLSRFLFLQFFDESHLNSHILHQFVVRNQLYNVIMIKTHEILTSEATIKFQCPERSEGQMFFI